MSDSAINYILTDIGAAHTDWAALEQHNNSGYFQSLTWQNVWHRLAKKYNYQAKLLKITDAGQTALICSFGQAQVSLLKIFKQSGIFLNASGKVDYDVICTENCQPLMLAQNNSELLSKFLNYLVNDLKANQILVNAVPVSKLELFRQACANCGLLLVENKRSAHFWIDLDVLRSNKQTHLQVVTQRTRGQIRKSQEAYQNKFGKLTVRHAASKQEAVEWLKCLMELNIANLERKNLSSSFKLPFLIEFHKELIESAFPKDEIVMVRFEAGEKIIGYIYGFCYKKIIYIYQTGFNFESDKKLTPGMLSHHLLIEEAQERGFLSYDFLAGDYQYKKSLSNQEEEFVWLQIVKPSFLFSLDQTLRNWKSSLLKPKK